MASHFSKESIMPVIFVLAFLAFMVAMAVLAGTLVYVLSVGLGALSMFAKRHERAIGCVACTCDICRKGVKKQWKKLSTR